MLVAMALLALGHCLVLLLMAERTYKSVVLSLGSGQKFVCGLMTGGAEFGWRICGVGYYCRHVRLVARLAVLHGHLCGMGLVALRTWGNFAVNAMAGRAEERGVFALIITKLFNLRYVAGKAGGCQIGCQGNRQGSMRIRVAAETSFEVKMRLALMALVALRNVVL